MTCSYVYERGAAKGSACGREDCDVHFLAPLPDELLAEGWEQFARLHLLWMHEPSMRSVAVEPVSGAAGFRVVCMKSDELGNPVVGDALEPALFADALRRARAIRLAILAESAAAPRVEQGELFAGEVCQPVTRGAA